MALREEGAVDKGVIKCFFIISLSLLYSHYSLSLLHPSFGQGVGYIPEGRGFSRHEGREMRITELLIPVRGAYKVRNQFFTLCNIVSYSLLMVSIYLVLALFYLSPLALFLPMDIVCP